VTGTDLDEEGLQSMRGARPPLPWPRPMRAVQITRFGGPEVPQDGEQRFDISSAGVHSADTHQARS
jgi:hypothetical protein